MPKTEVIRSRVPADLKHDFEIFANKHGMSVSQALRQLMGQYIKREKELSRRREETLEALEDVQAGHIIDGDAVMSWLDSWGTDRELEPPL